ncbi:unnamed protein product [Natator depressus]
MPAPHWASDPPLVSPSTACPCLPLLLPWGARHGKGGPSPHRLDFNPHPHFQHKHNPNPTPAPLSVSGPGPQPGAGFCPPEPSSAGVVGKKCWREWGGQGAEGRHGWVGLGAVGDVIRECWGWGGLEAAGGGALQGGAGPQGCGTGLCPSVPPAGSTILLTSCFPLPLVIYFPGLGGWSCPVSLEQRCWGAEMGHAPGNSTRQSEVEEGTGSSPPQDTFQVGEGFRTAHNAPPPPHPDSVTSPPGSHCSHQHRLRLQPICRGAGPPAPHLHGGHNGAWTCSCLFPPSPPPPCRRSRRRSWAPAQPPL